MMRLVKTFGDWQAPICETNPNVPVPIGDPCTSCGVAFVAGDRGIIMPDWSARLFPAEHVWHLLCFVELFYAPPLAPLTPIIATPLVEHAA